MKKTISIFKFSLLLTFFFIGLNAKAENCDQMINLFCGAMDSMKVQVNKCTSFDDLENINFDKSLYALNDADVPDSCLKKPLTGIEKSKLKKSINGFFDAMAEQMANLSGGVISKTYAYEQFKPLKDQISKMVDSSKNFDELNNKLGTL